MDYTQFLNSVCDYINEQSEDIKVSIHTAVKNNGVKLSGLTFCKAGYNASPTVYMENYYTDYLNGSDISEIGNRLLELYRENSMAANIDMSFFEDWGLVRTRLFIKLINKEKNADFLHEAPYEDFLDLAIVAYIRISDRKIGNGLIMVRNEHLRLWGVNAAEVLGIAKANTHDHDDYSLSYIVDVLANMGAGHLVPNTDPVQFPMYVATNGKNTCGAAVLTMKDKLKEFADVIGGDYYIIPSSVHELILLLKGDDSDRDEIDKMIRDVNTRELSADEVLADHAYMYSRDDEVLIF